MTAKSNKTNTEPSKILVVDDHPQARESMGEILRHAGYDVQCVSSAVEGLARLAEHNYDVVLTDLQMPGMSGLEFIREIEQRRHGAQVAMVTAHATVRSAVEAMRHGAFDYIEKPFDVDQLEHLVSRALEHGRLLDKKPAGSANAAAPHNEMIGNSQAMKALRERITQIAATSETVLISGESGTGKELVARSIHACSPRRQAPLVSLNCPVLSEQLMESELFGHERGAFTGADGPRTGRFELADSGTILLDEVTEIALSLQAKLLRVLQERTFERVGSSKTLSVDVRVLATTNRLLRDEVTAGRFREDLYYRLNVLPLHVPALRERPEDIPELINHFLHRAAQRLNKAPCQVDASATDMLVSYHWPGNIRELENIVTRACVLNGGSAIGPDELRPWLIDATSGDDLASGNSPMPGVSLHEMERQLIETTLEHFDGHRAKTAEALGIGIRTLSGKLKSYGYAPRAKVSSSSMVTKARAA